MTWTLWRGDTPVGHVSYRFPSTGRRGFTGLFAPTAAFDAVGPIDQILIPGEPARLVQTLEEAPRGVVARGQNFASHTVSLQPVDPEDLLAPGDARALRLCDPAGRERATELIRIQRLANDAGPLDAERVRSLCQRDGIEFTPWLLTTILTDPGSQDALPAGRPG